MVLFGRVCLTEEDLALRGMLASLLDPIFCEVELQLFEFLDKFYCVMVTEILSSVNLPVS